MTFLGKGWDFAVTQLRNVGYDSQRLGFVDVYLDEIIKYDIQLTPISVGTGTKGKVLDALANGLMVKNADILILGITFKENCPDIRNTKVVDIYHTLKEYTNNITVCDPWAYPNMVKKAYGIEIESSIDKVKDKKYDAIILAVAHTKFEGMDVRSLLKDSANGVVYDVKGFLPREVVDARL
jgi:UDP-N-acetyl-D-mannosaminuronate dehydrogenase